MSERDALGAVDGDALDPGGLDPEALGEGALAPAPHRGAAAHSRARARTVAGLLLVAVALTGVVGGITLDRWMLAQGYWRPGRPFDGPPRRGRRDPVEEQQRLTSYLTRELALTPQQRVRIDSVVGLQVRGVHALWREMRPRMDSVIDRTRAQIEQELTPAQRTKFREMRARRERRMREGGLGGPPPP